MKHKKLWIQIFFGSCISFFVQTTAGQGYVAGQQGPAGGTGGSYCKTTSLGGKMRSVTVKSGAYIDALDINYDSKADPSNIICGGSGGSPKTLTLIEGEYIVRVTGKYNKFVEYLYIQTTGTRQQYMDFGNKNTTAQGYFDYQAIDGTKIGNFIVKAGQYVDAIGVVIQKR